MFWVGFYYSGKTQVQFIDTTMNSVGYTRLLNSALFPFVNEKFDNNYIFQQDNASCHRAKNTEEWFENKGVRVMEWPARSPDFNPVENLFGRIVRKVYEGNKQFDTINQLKLAILLAWNEIEDDILKTLIFSMPKKMHKVLESHGGSINY